MGRMTDDPCPLCGRPLGTDNIDRHHLVPKSLKGREQFPIHRICHRKIHATFSERELLRAYERRACGKPAHD